MEKEETIKFIKERIQEAYGRHNESFTPLDWPEMAARKIYSYLSEKKVINNTIKHDPIIEEEWCVCEELCYDEDGNRICSRCNKLA